MDTAHKSQCISSTRHQQTWHARHASWSHRHLQNHNTGDIREKRRRPCHGSERTRLGPQISEHGIVIDHESVLSSQGTATLIKNLSRTISTGTGRKKYTPTGLTLQRVQVML